MAEYDEKNQELYDANTDKIHKALDTIRQDKSLKVTKAQVSSLTGLHRNTLSTQGSRDWVGIELEIIKNERENDSKRSSITKKKQENNLQKLLDQAKLEILHWFTLCKEHERELEKLRIRLNRDNDSLEWYKKELKKERKSKSELEERIQLLESVIDKK